MKRRLYFVGQGGSSWRDRRNWSLEEGGAPLRHFYARGNDHVIVCGVDGHEYLDLRGMPHGAITIRGYRGRLRLPNGARLSLEPTRWARLRARIRRELEPVVPPSFIAAVDMAGGWRRSVLAGLASVGIIPRRGAMLIPSISGGSGFVQETCHGSNSGGSSSQAATVVNAPSSAAGTMLVLSFSGARSATPDSTSLSSVTDSKGNTWAIDRQASGTTNATAAIASTMMDAGVLTTSDSITVNTIQGVDLLGYVFAVHEVSGIAPGTRVDVGASNSNTANSTSRSAGTTATTANAVEFVWAVFAPNGTETSFTPAAGYSSPATAFYVVSGGGLSVEFAYKVTSATGTQNPTGTGGVSTRHRGVCVCYKTISPVTKTASLPYESLKGLAQTATEPYEALKGLAATATAPYEALKRLAATASEPYESTAGISKSLAEPYETLAGLAKSGSLPYSALAGLRSSGVFPYSVLLALAGAAAFPYEALEQLRLSATEPYESGAGVASTGVLPYEDLQAIAETSGLPYETLRALAAISTLPYSTLVAIAAEAGLDYEALAGLVVVTGLPYEALAAISGDATLPSETLAGVALLAVLPYETLSAVTRVTALAELPYETLAAAVVIAGIGVTDGQIVVVASAQGSISVISATAGEVIATASTDGSLQP